jgi:hypothetical protein
LAPAACRKPDTVAVENTEPAPAARLSSMVHAADPGTAAQLKEGFHTVEQEAWRWTGKSFAVALGVPEGAAQAGAVLTLRLVIPEPVAAQLGPLTLSADLGGVSLPPETYAKPGEYIYSRDVPSAVLAGDSVVVAFSADKAIPPGPADRRELALIFSSVSLEAK